MLTIPPKLKQRRECKKRQKDIMNGLLNNYDTETVVSDNATIDDCVQAPINLKIRGKEIKQETRNGYNLSNTLHIVSRVVGGITVTNNNDGSISLKGIADTDFSNTGISLIEKIDITEENAGFYTVQLFGVPENVENGWVNVYYMGNLKNEQVVSRNMEVGQVFQMMFRCNLGTEVDCIIKPFLIKGNYTVETLPSYEEFGQSPSLEFESKLEYVEGNQELLHTNENLIDIKSKMFTIANSGNIKINIVDNDIILNGTPTVSYVGLSTRINITDILKDAQTYTMYRENDNLVYNQISAIKYDGSVDYYSLNGSANRRTFIVDKTKYRKYEYYVQTNVLSVMKSLKNYIVRCMLIESDKVPEKFSSYSETINLTNLPEMYSENDYIYYDENKKKYFVHNEWNKLIFNSSTKFEQATILGDFFRVALKNFVGTDTIISSKNGVCNYLPVKDGYRLEEEHIYKYNDYIYIFVPLDFASTIEELKTKLDKFEQSENSMCFIYKLKEATDTEITDTVLMQQLDNLRKMITYEGSNHFIVTNEDGQAMNLEVTVYKNSIKIMQKEIDNIKALVLENTVS